MHYTVMAPCPDNFWGDVGGASALECLCEINVGYLMHCVNGLGECCLGLCLDMATPMQSVRL